MTEKPNNPTAFPCCRCRLVANHRQGHQWLCSKHYRFGQMRASAKRNNKYVPSWQLLEILNEVYGLICLDCSVRMNWLSKDGQCTVVTLQHYRDESIGLVCRSCNTRHYCMEGDSYRLMNKDRKFCPKCKAIKLDIEFSKDNTRSGNLNRKSWCKACCNKSHKRWSDACRKGEI